jgi:uncharacterized protein YdeI (BOF family)
MKKTIITTLVTLFATVTFAHDQAKTNYCTQQALQIQKMAADINELAVHGKINVGEQSTLLEMLNNTYKGYLLICSQK